jgi:hypothetical protein
LMGLSCASTGMIIGGQFPDPPDRNILYES